MAEGEERPSVEGQGEGASAGGGEEKGEYYPIGFRFEPTPEEMVEFYLLPKLQGRPTVPNDFVIEGDAYECDPETLTRKYKDRGADDNWYFLSPRTRKYPGGDRPSRRTGDNRGRWKASTGQSKPGDAAAAGHSGGARKNKKQPLRVGAVQFTDNTLAYHLGPTKNEAKTKWLMQEFTSVQSGKDKANGVGGDEAGNHMLLNRYVMCRIYKSPLKKWRENEEESGGSSSSAASASASAAEDVATSSGSGPAPAPESVPDTPQSILAGKRPAVEQQPGGHANASPPNKRPFQPTKAPPGPAAPAHGTGGGGGMRGQLVYHGAPGHPGSAQLPRPPPPAMHSSLQGPAPQRPPLMCRRDGRTVAVPYNGQQATVQRLRPPCNGQQAPVLRLRPPHRPAAPGSLGGGTMRPPNVAPGQGQPVRPPSFPRPPLPPPTQQQELLQMYMYEQRVFTQFAAALREQEAAQDSARPAAQQQGSAPAAASAPPQEPGLDAAGGVQHPAGSRAAMVPHGQFPAAHSGYPLQSRTCPAPRDTTGAAGPAIEVTPAAGDAPSL